MNADATNITEDTDRFQSFDSMRAAHTDVLRLQREQKEIHLIIDKILGFIRRGVQTGELLDQEDERQAAQSLLDYWSTHLIRIHQEAPETALAEFDPMLAPELDDSLCPYRGLAAFDEADSAIFFGRQKFIKSLIEHLKNNTVLVVTGPSGSGKSSIVRAGLIPILKGGALENSESWCYLPVIVPGSAPLEALLKLLHALPPGKENPSEPVGAPDAAAFLQDSQYLLHLIRERTSAPVVIVIDQFEELFTLCDDNQTRQAFVNNLYVVARENPGNEAPPRNRLILTIRTDFEAKLALLPDFQPIFERYLVRVTPLNAAELRQAIEEPANGVGLHLEEGVVDALLNDILGEPAALPLLQFTLLKLWDLRERNRVTWEAFRHLGGGRQALATSADEFYDHLIPEEQNTARRILLRLVRPGEGLEITSSRIRRKELYVKAEAHDRIDRVLDKFIQARLLRLTHGGTPEDDQIEVAHEALVRNWPMLVSWLDQEREAIRERQRLTRSAEKWEHYKRDEGALLRGALLEDALDQKFDDLSPLEAEFLNASQAAEHAERTRRERLRWGILSAMVLAALIMMILGLWGLNRSMIVSAQASTVTNALGVVQEQAKTVQAESNSRATAEVHAIAQQGTAEAASTKAIEEKSAQETASSLAKAQHATAVAAITQIFQQQATVESERIRADQESQKALSNQLAEQALNLAGKQLDLALLLSLESLRIDEYSLASHGNLLNVLRANPRLRVYLRGHNSPVTGVAFNSQGDQIATIGVNGQILIWDAENGALVEDSYSMPYSAYHIAFHPTENWLLAGGCGKLDRSGNCEQGLMRFWNLDKPNSKAEERREHTAMVSSAVFGGRGRLVASGSADGVVIIWNSPTIAGVSDSKLLSITENKGDILSLAFDPMSYRLAAGDAGGLVIIHDTRSAITGDLAQPINILMQLSAQAGSINSLSWSPDGVYLAAGAEDGTILIWDTTKGILATNPLKRHTYGVTSVAFSPDGRYLASGSRDGMLILWDLSLVSKNKLENQPPSIPLTGHTDSILSVAFSPDGKQLASSGRDGVVILWYVYDPLLLGLLLDNSDNSVNGLAFSQDGNQLLVSRTDRSYVRWDAAQAIASNGAAWQQVGYSGQYPSQVQNIIPASENLYGLQIQEKQASEVKGIDVAWWTGSIDWPVVHRQGIRFAYIRATEGESNIDNSFQEYWQAARKAGILVGAYHYFHPAQDPEKQAKNFLEQASKLLKQEGSLPPVLDIELTEEIDINQMMENLRTWIKIVEAETGRKPVIYTSPVFWNQIFGGDSYIQASQSAPPPPLLGAEYPLFVAYYSAAQDPPLPTGWSSWSFWQYSDAGVLDGMESKVSLSRFNGSLEELQALALQAPAPTASESDISALTIKNLITNEPIGVSLPQLQASCAALHPSQKILAVGNANGTISFWDMEQGIQIGSLLYASGIDINSLAYSLDGRHLAAGLDDGTVIIWTPSEPNLPPAALKGHAGPVLSVAFSTDGRILATGGADAAIFLWDLQTFHNIGQALTMPGAAVTALAFNPPNTILAAGSADGRLVLWDIDPRSWQQQACELAARNLTPTEWQKYFPNEDYQETCIPNIPAS